MYGYHSEEASKRYGEKYYLTPEGKVVPVTLVTDNLYTPKELVRFYKWNDSVFVSEVTRFVNTSQTSTGGNFSW